jgi:hypothetical protein
LTIRKDLPGETAQMPMCAASGFITALPVIGVSEEGDP